MLIACLSDIHANLPALEAAVADARTRGATAILCAGDVVGYGPFPNEVCSFLEQSDIVSIAGNYDLKVLAAISNGDQAGVTLAKKKRELLSWTAKHLKKAARAFLEALPERLEQSLPENRSLLMVHGSPLSNDDDILPSITAQAIKIKLGQLNPDVLICGHTHIPFVKKIGGTLVINCGSAGLPVDGDPRPSYALLSIDDGLISARIVRFEYDVNQVVKALKATSLPEGIQLDFIHGSKRRFLQ
jgi:putative phosphoesterase